MYEFTPNASWTTMTAPRVSLTGRASYSGICPCVVSSSMVRVSTDAPSVSGVGIEGGAQLGDVPGCLVRPPAGQHPSHQRAPDYHTVGRPCSCHRLRGRGDPHPEQHGHVGCRLATPAHVDGLVGEGRPLAGHAQERYAVYEAARPIADRAKPLVGSRWRREQDRFDAGGVGELGGEPLGARVGDDVVIRHDDERDAHVELRGFGNDLRRRGAEIERALRRLLDGAPVHDGVGERDADLDGVGARVGDRSHHVEPARTETAGDVRREQGMPGVASVAQMGLELHASRSPVPRSATWAASLSPRPESVTSTVDPAGTDRPASRASHATAWAGSSAGTIPSMTESSSNPATASSSVAYGYSARPVAASCACSGPTPG